MDPLDEFDDLENELLQNDDAIEREFGSVEFQAILNEGETIDDYMNENNDSASQESDMALPAGTMQQVPENGFALCYLETPQQLDILPISELVFDQTTMGTMMDVDVPIQLPDQTFFNVESKSLVLYTSRDRLSVEEVKRTLEGRDMTNTGVAPVEQMDSQLQTEFSPPVLSFTDVLSTNVIVMTDGTSISVEDSNLAGATADGPLVDPASISLFEPVSNRLKRERNSAASSSAQQATGWTNRRGVQLCRGKELPSKAKLEVIFDIAQDEKKPIEFVYRRLLSQVFGHTLAAGTHLQPDRARLDEIRDVLDRMFPPENESERAEMLFDVRRNWMRAERRSLVKAERTAEVNQRQNYGTWGRDGTQRGTAADANSVHSSSMNAEQQNESCDANGVLSGNSKQRSDTRIDTSSSARRGNTAKQWYPLPPPKLPRFILRKGEGGRYSVTGGGSNKQNDSGETEYEESDQEERSSDN